MSVKYNMQPCDWPVYRDLVMTSPYDDVIIHCNMPSPDWSSIQEGKGADKPSRSGVRRKKRKRKRKKRKIKNKIKIKAKQIQKRKKQIKKLKEEKQK